MSDLAIEFCGEWFRPVAEGEPFEIGREGDLAIDDNPYLHRRFLRVAHEDGSWWLANVGSLFSATVCDSGGGVQSWLPPGNRLPRVFPTTSIVVTAGPTTYELTAQIDDAPYHEIHAEDSDTGATTIGMISSFRAMSHAGAPDAVQLAVVISEELVNSALGLTTAIIGILLYNYFSTRVDNFQSAIEETSFEVLDLLRHSKVS